MENANAGRAPTPNKHDPDKEGTGIKTLSTQKTKFGYEIRKEQWPNPDFEAVVIDDGGDPEMVAEVMDALAQGAEPEFLEMTSCWTDDGYWIGDEERAKYVCEVLGIAPKPSEGVKPGDLRPCQHGWSEKDQSWYGWSHRAMCMFSVGSVVSIGDVAYVPTDQDDALAAAVRFWQEPSALDVKGQFIGVDEESGRPMFEITWTRSLDPALVPNEKLRGKKASITHYGPDKYGRGAWTAETLDDARQMAQDFAEGVS